MFWYELWFVSLIGLLLGSFSTAITYRAPRKIPWGAERSICPLCNTTLGAFDLMPVLSWAFSGGKCRHCNAPISWRYPLTEVVCALLCIAVYLAYGFNVTMFFTIAIIPFLMALFLIDLEHFILPNLLVLNVFLIGVAKLMYQVFYAGMLDLKMTAIEYGGGAIIYAALVFILGLVVSKVMKKDALGFGDVKFFGVAGLWLGLSSLSWFLLLSGGFAVIFAVIWRKAKGEEVFPFGPALILSFYTLVISAGGFLW